MESQMGYFLISSIFFLCAGYLGWKMFDQERKTAASKQWSYAKAMILSKIVAEGYVRHWKVFTPKILYAYKVDGEYITGIISLKPELVANAVWLSPDSEKFLKARKITQHRLEKMAENIEIRYNPENPKERVCFFNPINTTVPRS